MIVLVDQKNELITLYTEDGRDVFHFDDAQDFVDKVRYRKVLYITNAIETTANEVAKLVSNSATGDDNTNRDQQYFIRSTVRGVLHIQDIDLSFRGIGDCKPIDAELAELIQQSFQLKQMIKLGKVEIINEKQMRKVVRAAQKEELKKDEIRKKKEERELDSILVKDNVRAEDIAGSMFEGEEDDDTLWLSTEEGKDEETEIEQIMKTLGKKGDE